MANKLHLDNWITKAEPDYYTMFIKAWIPFNAWYVTEFGTKRDKEALSKMSTSKNKIRNRIEALLKNDDPISKEFRFQLAHLHKELSDRSIMSSGKKVSLDEVVLDDYLPKPQVYTANRIIYKGIPDKATGYKIIVVAHDNSKTYMDKTFNPYDIASFELDNQFIGLPNKKMRAQARKIFESINPQKPLSIISKSKTLGEYILLDPILKTKIINDTELTAKALIAILYSLRCLLFHGELDPTETNQPLYRYAFFILKTLINELK